MPVYHRLERPDKQVQFFPAIKRQQPLQHIRIALPFQQMMKKNTLLQRRQRVDVLDVWRASAHTLHDPIDLGLLQVQQRKHLGRDAIAVLGNEVLRNFDAGTTLDSFGEPLQG